MSVVRAPWSSASFLVYAGGLTVLATALWLLSILSDDYAKAAFVGWSLLVLAFVWFCALSFRFGGRPVVAGLFVVTTVIAFGFFVGALFDWFGWLPEDVLAPFDGFHVGLLLVLLLTFLAAIVALRSFRFPLLVLVAAATLWYFVVDFLSNGGNWSAWVSIFFGLAVLLVALGANEYSAFWLHVVSGLTIGGGLLWFWHNGDWDWIFIAIVALVYVAVAGGLERSSWAVLGAFGLFLSTTHWVDKWFGIPNPLRFFGLREEAPEHEWARPISYAVMGFVFILLGLWLDRRRRAPMSAPTA